MTTVDLPEETIKLPDEFDGAFIGLGESVNDLVAVYDKNKVLNTLMAINNWDITDAVEWYEFNMLGAYVGGPMPVFVELEV